MEGDRETFCATIKPVPRHQPCEPQHLFDNSCSAEISHFAQAGTTQMCRTINKALTKSSPLWMISRQRPAATLSTCEKKKIHWSYTKIALPGLVLEANIIACCIWSALLHGIVNLHWHQHHDDQAADTILDTFLTIRRKMTCTVRFLKTGLLIYNALCNTLHSPTTADVTGKPGLTSRLYEENTVRLWTKIRAWCNVWNSEPAEVFLFDDRWNYTRRGTQSELKHALRVILLCVCLTVCLVDWRRGHSKSLSIVKPSVDQWVWCSLI